jgi:hypothetical protein
MAGADQLPDSLLYFEYKMVQGSQIPGGHGAIIRPSKYRVTDEVARQHKRPLVTVQEIIDQIAPSGLAAVEATSHLSLQDACDQMYREYDIHFGVDQLRLVRDVINSHVNSIRS